ncbi:MAG: ThiF family adenylyltransferase [Nitrospira sp.]|nr:ThiF family adenylyltransferase [Nitrospira sp.]
MTEPARLTLSSHPAIPMFQPQRYVVIGLGGIGSILADYLSRFLMANGQGTPLCVIDGDQYEEHNRTRMRFESYENKAVAKSRELGHQTRRALTILPTPTYVTKENINEIIQERDAVLLCVDNHATRQLVSDHCQSLRTVALISGGNDGVDETHSGTFGNVQVMLRREGHNLTNALTTYHPEIAQPADHHPDDPGCDDLQPTLPQLLFTNLAVASGMLSTLYAWQHDRLTYEELYFDIFAGRTVPIRRAPHGSRRDQPIEDRLQLGARGNLLPQGSNPDQNAHVDSINSQEGLSWKD